MPTLADIKKERGLTNATIAKRIDCSTSKAGMIIQGRYIRVMNDQDITQLAQALEITFERCWLSMQESYNQWAGKPLDTQHERAQEMQYRVASEMGLEYTAPVPHNTSIDGIIVVEGLKQLAQKELHHE